MMALLYDSAAQDLEATDCKTLWDTGVVPGSTQDFARRLRALLPLGWFPLAPQGGESEAAPALYAILLGFGSVFASFFVLLGQVVAQTRLATMTGSFLDMAAADYFGSEDVLRRSGEADTTYRARIAASLVAPRNTRASVVAAISSVTGTVPALIEPMNAADCHALGAVNTPACGGGFGFGTSGLRYGSMNGGQFFVETSRGNSAGVSAIADAVEFVKAAGINAWIRVED